MTQHDDIEEIDRAGGTAFRRVARILIVACGLMIALVVLSDPRVTGAARDALARFEADDAVVTRQDNAAAFPALTMAAPVAEAALDDSAAPQEPARPRVSVLPESRVNVIRLTD